MHVVSGQLKQPHVLVGDGIKGAAGKQDEWNTTGGHLGYPLTPLSENLGGKQKEELLILWEPDDGTQM